MTYYFHTSRCPYCNQIVERKKTTNRDFDYGSPFRDCPFCRKEYFDGFYKEEGLVLFQRKSNSYVDNSFFHVIFAIFGFFTVILTVVFFVFKRAYLYAVPCGLLSVLFGYLFFERVRENKKNPKTPEQVAFQDAINIVEGVQTTLSFDLENSMKRLSNRQYLDKLKNSGVTVPQYFYDRIEPVQTLKPITCQPDNVAPKYNEGDYRYELENTKTMIEDFRASNTSFNENALSTYCIRIAHVFSLMRNDSSVDDTAYLDAGNAFRTIALSFEEKNKDKLSASFMIKKLQAITGFPTEFYATLAEDEKQLSDQVDTKETESISENPQPAVAVETEGLEVKENGKMNTPIENISSVPLFVADELSKLKQLKDAGVLTEKEFTAQKKKLLGE